MDNLKKINKLSKEYFVVRDGKPVCPPFNDEPGIFDNQVMPIYRAFREVFPDSTHIVCVTTFDTVDEKSE